VKNDFTICFVSYLSGPYIELNISLIIKLNPRVTIKWLIVENSPYDYSFNYKKNFKNEDINILDGYRDYKLNCGSTHHAIGIHEALKFVESNYFILIDPDFFIVQSNWIENLLENMQKKDVKFFGAPYYPNHKTKYRYYPTAIFSVINTSKITKWDLNYFPKLEIMKIMRNHSYKSLFKTLITNNGSPLLLFIIFEKIFSRIIGKPNQACTTYSTRDTGYRVYRTLKNEKYEILTPNWINPLYSKIGNCNYKYLIIKLIVPDFLSPYPKKKSYTQDQFFKDFNLPDVSIKEWEEFSWSGIPFAFHVRGVAQGKTKVDLKELKNILYKFMDVG